MAYRASGIEDRGTSGIRDRGTSGIRDRGTSGIRDRNAWGPEIVCFFVKHFLRHWGLEQRSRRETRRK